MSTFKQIVLPPITKYKVTESDLALINFLTNFQADEFLLSQKELSKNANVSVSSITRFCHKMGYKNYKDFAQKFREQIWRIHSYDFKQDDDYSVYDLITSYRFIVEDLPSEQIIKEAEKIATKVTTAKRVYVFGMGSSFLLAKELTIYLARMGINVLDFEDFSSFLASAKQMDKGDLLICVSISFSHEEIFYAINNISEATEIALISSNQHPNQHLTRNLNYFFQIRRIKKFEFDIPFSSKVGIMMVIDMIIVMSFQKIDQDLKDKFIDGEILLRKWKTSY